MIAVHAAIAAAGSRVGHRSGVAPCALAQALLTIAMHSRLFRIKDKDKMRLKNSDDLSAGNSETLEFAGAFDDGSRPYWNPYGGLIPILRRS